MSLEGPAEPAWPILMKAAWRSLDCGLGCWWSRRGFRCWRGSVWWWLCELRSFWSWSSLWHCSGLLMALGLLDCQWSGFRWCSELGHRGRAPGSRSARFGMRCCPSSSAAYLAELWADFGELLPGPRQPLQLLRSREYSWVFWKVAWSIAFEKHLSQPIWPFGQCWHHWKLI